MRGLISIHCLLTILLLVSFYAEANTDCKNISQFKIPHNKILFAEEVSSGKFDAPDGISYEVPKFCRVSGVSQPVPDSIITFEVWLPVGNWNGRYHHLPGFGITYGGLVNLVSSGYAVTSTDSGIGENAMKALRSGNNPWAWAISHPERIIDFTYRSHKETSDSARAIIQEYYNKPAEYAYMSGCSIGGFLGLMAATRYPEDWDGILAGSGVDDYLQLLTWMTVNVKEWVDNPDARIPPEKLPFIQKKALAACRSEAHVVNGIAGDPRSCRYDPEVLLCKGDESGTCLNNAQVENLKKIYNGTPDPKTGKIPVQPGLVPTLESETRGWGSTFDGGWISDVTGRGDALRLKNVAPQFVGSIIYGDPSWDFKTFGYYDAIEKAESRRLSESESVASVLRIDTTNWPKVKDKGVKIIRYQGWGNETETPETTIDEYKTVMNETGGLEKSQEFYRLFIAPGMLHCAGGPGPVSFGQSRQSIWTDRTKPLKPTAEYDVFMALEDWVEKNEAPDQLIGTKYIDDDPEKGIKFTRPICAYPKVTAYRNTGSKDLQENFECVDVKE